MAAYTGSFTRIGGVYEASPDALVAGNYGILRLTSAGLLMVEAAMASGSVVQLAAGTALAGKFGIDQTTPGTTNGVVVAGTTGVAPLAHAAGSASSRVLRASPGDLDFFVVNTGAVAGWIFLQDASSAQGNGAISSAFKAQWSANSTFMLGFNPPLKATTGWVAYFSTTGPDTLTLSATASFGGRLV